MKFTINIFSVLFFILFNGFLVTGIKAQQPSYDMNSYWNIVPGNYWIFESKNYKINPPGSANQNQTYITRWDVENKTTICGSDKLSGYPILYSKNSPYTYWSASWELQTSDALEGSYIRLFFKEYADDCPFGLNPCYGFNIWKLYKADFTKPFIMDDITSYDTVGVGIENSGVSYYQSPKYLSNRQQIFETDKQYFYSSKSLDKDTYCNQMLNNNGATYGIKEAISYKAVNIDTKAYQGEALVVIQSEQLPRRGFTTKENWYLVKNIGLAKMTAKNFNVYTGLQCANVLSPTEGDDPDCGKDKELASPWFEMSLIKYYLGGKLNVSLNGEDNIRVKKGDSFLIQVIDPSTNYSYDGFLEINNRFLSPNGQGFVGAGRWNHWIDDGLLEVQIGESVSAGTYTTSFRPWIRRDQTEIDREKETIEDNNNILWSDRVTVIVEEDVCVSCDSDLTGFRSDANCDGKVDISDLLVWYGFYRTNIYNERADFNCDEKVNIGDLVVWYANYRK